MQNQSDYRSYLKSLLETKAKTNPAFSLRSFARLIGISPGHLSRVLKGEKKLSLEAAARLSSALRHSESEAAYFRDLVILAATSSPLARQETLERLERSSSNQRALSLELEHFKVISDWYHFGILNLLNTVRAKSDDRWIARRLGISVAEAKAGLQRLENLGLIEVTAGKYKVVQGPGLTTPDDIASAALRKFHKQMLKKAEDALNDQNLTEREFNALTVAFDPTQTPKAKRLIREFMDRMNIELEQKPGAEVYQLNVQFFRLSKLEKQ